MTSAGLAAMNGTGRIVSLSTALFDGYPMAEAFAEIASAGCQYVEPAFIKGYVDFEEDAFESAPAAALRRLADGASLRIHAVSAHMDLSSDDAVAMLSRRIRFAEDVGAKVLITNAGPASQRSSVIRVLETAVPLLERWGGRLAIENPGHGSGNLVGNAVDGKALVDALGSPLIRLNHDAGNVYTYSGGLLQPAPDFLRAREAIGHVHLKDVRVEGDGWQFCALGEGAVDLRSYLATIPDDLPLSIELPLRLIRPGRGDPMRAAEPLPLPVLRDALHRSLAFVAQAAVTQA